MSMRSTAVYLYCVVRAARKPPMTRVPGGVPGAGAADAHKVANALWVIAADVPLSQYGMAELEPRLRDLEWVSRAAVAHEAVVEHFTHRRGVTVIPAKLFTMFSALDKALADVAGRRRAIERDMKHIAGCEEWGIRVTRRIAPAAAAAVAKPASGSAFLAARKAARDAVLNARAQAAGAAEEAFARLARHARAATQRERRQEPGTNPPLLEAAFLVTAAARARFKREALEQARACAEAGADLTLTGPWPAYNFIGTSS